MGLQSLPQSHCNGLNQHQHHFSNSDSCFSSHKHQHQNFNNHLDQNQRFFDFFSCAFKGIGLSKEGTEYDMQNAMIDHYRRYICMYLRTKYTISYNLTFYTRWRKLRTSKLC